MVAIKYKIESVQKTALFWVQAEVGRLIEYGTVEQIFTAPQHDLTVAYVNGIRG